MLSWRILGIIFCANILTILPLPVPISDMRPAWVLLSLLFLQTYLPRYFNIGFIFVVGLCLDALLATPMGEHAFALLITTWLLVGSAPRFMFFSIMQQMLMVGLACGCYKTILFILDAAFGHKTAIAPIFGVVLTSMVVWWPLTILFGRKGVTDVR